MDARNLWLSRRAVLGALAARPEEVLPKEIGPRENAGLDRFPLTVSQLKARQQEVPEWQTVRQAFEAKRSTKRRRIPSA